MSVDRTLYYRVCIGISLLCMICYSPSFSVSVPNMSQFGQIEVEIHHPEQNDGSTECKTPDERRSSAVSTVGCSGRHPQKTQTWSETGGKSKHTTEKPLSSAPTSKKITMADENHTQADIQSKEKHKTQYAKTRSGRLIKPSWKVREDKEFVME